MNPPATPPMPFRDATGGAPVTQGAVTAPPSTAEGARAPRQARGWRYLWYRVRGSPLTLAGVALILLYLLVAAAAPLLAPVPEGWSGPYDVQASFGDQLLPPNSELCDGSCPFGTSEFGVDLYYGVVWGTRISVVMGVGITLAGILAGLLLGLVAGWYGGWVDDVVMRVTDVFLSLPLLVLAIAVVVAFGRGLDSVAAALIIIWWPPYTRLIRGQVLQIRESQYIEAARASGLPDWYIMGRHVVPNSIAPIVVQGTLDIGTVVLVAAALSFLGFAGTSSLLPEWGRLVALGQNYMATGEWWTVVFPGLAIFGFVLGFNLLGDGLRDILDPRGKR